MLLSHELSKLAVTCFFFFVVFFYKCPAFNLFFTYCCDYKIVLLICFFIILYVPIAFFLILLLIFLPVVTKHMSITNCFSDLIMAKFFPKVDLKG